MPDENKRLDAVFEGGGVKGTALVGAVAVTERKVSTKGHILKDG